MYREDDHSHYTVDEIKQRFNQGNWLVSADEYEQICKVISCLDTEQVRILSEEIFMVIIGEQKDREDEDKIMPACNLNLREELFKTKTGIIFLAPDLRRPCVILKKLYHELAHHVLDHRHEAGPEAIAKNEAEADKLAWKWFLREHPHLMDSAKSDKKTILPGIAGHPAGTGELPTSG